MMANSETPPTDLHEEPWENEKGIKRMADLLRGRKGMPVRNAVELGKRVEFFRGDKLGSFLLASPVAKKHFPSLQTKEDCRSVGRSLVRFGYIHRSERDAKNKKMLTPTKDHEFVHEGYYTWMYDGRKTLRNMLTALLIIGFLIITCFPIWPQWAKIALWYMSVTFLLLVAVFSLIRIIVFLLLWIGGYEFWIFPNIFDDNLSVADSFVPVYSLAGTSPSEQKYRIIVACAFVAFCYWIGQQPTDFDEYMLLTKQFTDDIYSGKLLSDMSQQDQDNIDKPKVPDLEDLLKEDHEVEHEEDDEDARFEKLLEDEEDEKEEL